MFYAIYFTIINKKSFQGLTISGFWKIRIFLSPSPTCHHEQSEGSRLSAQGKFREGSCNLNDNFRDSSLRSE
jgi:hypothetical protein